MQVLEHAEVRLEGEREVEGVAPVLAELAKEMVGPDSLISANSRVVANDDYSSKSERMLVASVGMFFLGMIVLMLVYAF